MKKTIAKIMAAAMILSAVPAVAVPTLTAEAALSDAKVIVFDGLPSGTKVLDSTGNTGVSVTGYTEYTVATGSTTSNDKKVAVTSITNQATTDTEPYDLYFTTGSGDDGVDVSGTKMYLKDYVNVSVSGEKMYLSLNTSKTGYGQVLTAAVKAAKNTVTVYVDAQNGITLLDDEDQTLTSDTIGTFRIGGVVNSTTDDKITTGIRAAGSDNNAVLKDGDVAAVISNAENLEVEILKGTGDISANDGLRGQTLDMTKVAIGGVEYKVTKIGAQALKQSHMKKLVIENTKTIGKGAIRKAKQVTKVDVSDANKVRKIHSKAFYGDKNLKTILIDGRKLNTVGSSAFSGVKKNCTIKIKAKKTKYNSDVKLIKKSGAKNVKFTRVAP